ncbi:Upf91.3 [Enterobacteria phage P7]|uniref:Upf91.3 n=2 Tax=root TaxID=1 RepID=A0A6G5ZYD0_ECOLX|nr:Upf91.3 [Enterobacteria phage P7]AAQ07568.1 Upf91.3 [Enterobacteria phage P7]QHW10996.1 Upf91.3 [Escherichia coli]QHW11210.1 hypothetical protein [Escherichia coli]
MHSGTEKKRSFRWFLVKCKGALAHVDVETQPLYSWIR